MIARIISYVCGAISTVFLIAIVLNNTIDHNLDFKTVITSMTVILSLVTICITVENYRKTSENTKPSIEIASLSTITNITKEYAARINETSLPMDNYGDIQLFLEKFTRLFNIIDKKTGGIGDYRYICVPYFSIPVIKELMTIYSIENCLTKSERVFNLSLTEHDLGGNARRLVDLRAFNKHAPILMGEYRNICFVLDLTISQTSITFIERYIEMYKLDDVEKPLTMGDLKRVQNPR